MKNWYQQNLHWVESNIFHLIMFQQLRIKYKLKMIDKEYKKGGHMCWVFAECS